MKKNLLFATLMASSLFIASCSKDDDNNEVVEKITFSDLQLNANSYWNGSDTSGMFTSGAATFNNSYNTEYASWSGFSYSNRNDTSTVAWPDQYDVYTAAANTNGTFALSFVSSYDAAPAVTFANPVMLKNADFALNTIAYKSMKNGDAMGGKKFAANDWYKITITAYDAAGTKIADKDVYLADFRDGKSLIADSWKNFDLSFSAKVSKLSFAASSTDNGQWGMNTPAYFCIDNIAYVK